MATPATRVYPVLPLGGADDPRFTTGLVLDVRSVVEAHGYPKFVGGLDLLDLRQALFTFLYDADDGRAGK